MNQCGLCERGIERGYLCHRDILALTERLGQLPLLHDELVHFLVPRRSGFSDIVATKSAPGPRSPLNEDVLDEMNSGNMAAVVHSWRVDVQRVRWPQHSAPPPGEFAADCRWLGMELEWIAEEYPAAGDLAREVRELETQARSIVGDPAPRPQRLGTCVAVDESGVVCGAAISRMPGETRLVCRWCGFVYEGGRAFLVLQHFQPKESA
ncbi:hypothetical protein H9W91_17510 [Streptomyces alfalfae]|uniref:hypothetical protein n=1 Tax=Streptomyces alfalfae TaxID=1642299 RepID=UPI001BA5B0E2|nr:hypothetical protein [Streptomyces alfalfae]QUI32459.1 hypothetical protein H9W91_17510 [Streptomyces alfalfae]